MIKRPATLANLAHFYLTNVLWHNLLWVRVMSVNIYIFGMEFTVESIYGLRFYPKGCIF